MSDSSLALGSLAISAKKREELLTDPLYNFVNQLRNYCLHIQPASLVLNISWTREDPRNKRAIKLRLDADDFEWKKESKEYIERQGDTVTLLDAATAYRDKVMGFHSWFEGQVGIHYGTVQSNLIREDKERALKEFEEAINVLVHDKQGIVFDDIQIFKLVVPGRDLQHLRAIADPSIRCRVAIRMLERRVSLREATKKKITYLYQHRTLRRPENDTQG